VARRPDEGGAKTHQVSLLPACSGKSGNKKGPVRDLFRRTSLRAEIYPT